MRERGGEEGYERGPEGCRKWVKKCFGVLLEEIIPSVRLTGVESSRVEPVKEVFRVDDGGSRYVLHSH